MKMAVAVGLSAGVANGRTHSTAVLMFNFTTVGMMINQIATVKYHMWNAAKVHPCLSVVVVVADHGLAGGLLLRCKPHAFTWRHSTLF